MVDTFTTHASWHIRETVMICVSVVMINNWPCLHAASKKLCKDIFMKGLDDVKPEVGRGSTYDTPYL